MNDYVWLYWLVLGELYDFDFELLLVIIILIKSFNKYQQLIKVLMINNHHYLNY